MLTKSTPPEMKALYDEAIEIYNTHPTSEVIGGGRDSLTIVIVRREGTDQHDVWFFAFPQSAEKVAAFSTKGEYLILYNQALVKEDRILREMKALPEVLKERREWSYLVEIGIGYTTATAPPEPVAEKKRGTRRV